MQTTPFPIRDFARRRCQGKVIGMKDKVSAIMVEEFLFGQGVRLVDYFIEQTPVSEMLCYRNTDGRDFDLPINGPALADAVLIRLKELGARVVKLG